MICFSLGINTLYQAYNENRVLDKDGNIVQQKETYSKYRNKQYLHPENIAIVSKKTLNSSFLWEKIGFEFGHEMFILNECQFNICKIMNIAKIN